MCCVKKVVQNMAPVLMPIYLKPPKLCFNYLYPVWIFAVQSALKHTRKVVTQCQLGEVWNLMQHSFYQSDTVALLLTTTIDMPKPQIYAMKASNRKNTTLV